MTRGLLLHVSVEIVLHCCIILAVSDNQITCLKTKLTSHGPRLLGCSGVLSVFFQAEEEDAGSK